MRRIETSALLVRSVGFGESDVIATFFTENEGTVSAVVRSARRSTKRFGGALEPIHEVIVTLEDRGKELCVLKEARIRHPRTGIVSDLDAMDAAGRALRWVRHLCPSRTPEPAVWASLEALLDVLDALDARFPPLPYLAIFGLGLLGGVGYAIDFERCVRCGRPCPDGRRAFLDAIGGGLVCMTCGGARRTVSAALRRLAVRAQAREVPLSMTSAQALELLAIVEEAMSAHADFDPRGG